MTIQEPVTVGLSDAAKEKLHQLVDDRIFKQQIDAYRFAIGLALAQGIDPPEVQKIGTIFNVGTFDGDGTVKLSIQTVMGDRLQGIAVYKMAERLAEWGINELSSQSQNGPINFVDLLDQASG